MLCGRLPLRRISGRQSAGDFSRRGSGASFLDEPGAPGLRHVREIIFPLVSPGLEDLFGGDAQCVGELLQCAKFDRRLGLQYSREAHLVDAKLWRELAERHISHGSEKIISDPDIHRDRLVLATTL